MGRELRNCVADESGARRYLGDPDTTLWALQDREQRALQDREQRAPRCLMEVDVDSRKITQCFGFENSTPKLKRSLAFAILDALDVSGDDLKAFARVGAYGVFRDGQPEGETVEAGGRRYRIWILDGGRKIVVAARKRAGGHRRWSIFVRDGGEIDGNFHNALSTDKLLALVLDHPVLAAALRGPAG